MTIRILVHSAVYGGLILCNSNCFAATSAKEAVDVPVAGSPTVSTGEDGGTALDANNRSAGLLERVRVANERLYSSLQSFVCDEHMERYAGSQSGDNARHIDTLETKVSFENGSEHYTGVLQNKQPRESISGVSGAWSEGEFGTLLQQTEILLDALPVSFRTYTNLNGMAAAVYTVDITEQNSPWDLEVARHHYRIPFRTDVWVARATGEIQKIERVSTGIPWQIGISEIRWSVTLAPVKLDQKTWLLPKTGRYEVLYEGLGRREWNDMTFSDYHRYGSEVALRFE